ncbi:hypothetical protein BTR40_24495 [Vibrio parahaemolyticus]|uniref:DUF4145 domain-containing protein n=1 Tax=Vibrio parahaemolyticus TaxID=670 RepID=UPI000A3A5BAE|nr:DUF4145 domain-containing protein [Vibrio parahaemolyticus]OUJ32373.1 hypothetical protein BTR40_24495 [Vibrio parahaemolyticus]
MIFFDQRNMNWSHIQRVSNKSYRCGYCNDQVSSDRGYKIGEYGDGSGNQRGGIYICSRCSGPTFFNVNGFRFPAISFGNTVAHVPPGLNALYEEARRCTSQGCYTAAVLLCRKALMNIAVEQGAAENLRFIEYVNYLSENGYTPPNGRHWVDHIRRKGNEATHEIALMEEGDAKDLICFLEMLLKFIYEFPASIPQPEE